MRKLILLTLALLLLTGALAQEGPAQFETRLSIVESRLTRIEQDVSRLYEVPTALARIEEKLSAVIEKSQGLSSVAETISVGVIMTVIGLVIGHVVGKRNKAP